LHRAGELVPVAIPEAPDEAIRDLVRAREDAVSDQRRVRQRLKFFLLRHGYLYGYTPGAEARAPTGCALLQLPLPFRDLVRVHIELLRQFGQRALALDRCQRHLRFERR
jgi:hypothetical protein